jgi:sugar lactone lactonase YvrE
MSETPRAGTASGGPASVRSSRGRRILGLVLVVLVLLLGLSTYLLYGLYAVPGGSSRSATPSADTGGLTWVRSIYGTSNLPQDLFGQTVAAVPGADGSVWVTDAKTRAIMRFTADGRYAGVLNSVDASGPLQAPSRFAVGPDGLIYVCETALDTVRVLRPDGTDEGAISVPQPVSVAVSGDRIAVGSVYGFAILDSLGKPIKVVGSRGKGEDQFDYVHGIAIDAGGNVYVSDSYNNRLSAYDRNGKRLWIIRTGAPANSAVIDGGLLAPQRETTGAVLTGADALQLPLGLTIDGAGRVVVADMYDCALAVFEAKTGKFIGKYGEAGGRDGQFFYPVSVGYDRDRDWFTVADSFNNRIEIVRIPGSSGGNGVVALAKRSLAGPLRACMFPFVLLLIAFVVWLIVRFLRRRRQMQAADAADGPGALTDDGSGSPDVADEPFDDGV